VDVQNKDSFFNKVYDDTYNHTLKYVILRCSDLNNISDIMQEVYLDLYKVISKKGTDHIRNYEAYTIKLAKAKVYKNYSLLEKLKKLVPLYNENNQGDDTLADTIADDAFENDVENLVISSRTAEDIWNIIRKKPQDIQRIFYLYYICDLEIRVIAKEMNLGEATVKTKLYRTLKNIRKLYCERSDIL
jgi:RNA polymerase sigma-70 factor (ECF subfamily)